MELIRLKRKNIKTKIINQKDYESKKDFENALTNTLKNQNVDLVCLAGFMSILSKNFLKDWNRKVINIHPSLLPSFRGKNAVKQALEQRVKTAGCSVHFVDEGIDTGEIISQEKVPVSSNDDEETLGKKILKKEHVLYIKVIKKLERNCF